jgi:hypothetical protein
MRASNSIAAVSWPARSYMVRTSQVGAHVGRRGQGSSLYHGGRLHNGSRLGRGSHPASVAPDVGAALLPGEESSRVDLLDCLAICATSISCSRDTETYYPLSLTDDPCVIV